MGFEVTPARENLENKSQDKQNIQEYFVEAGKKVPNDRLEEVKGKQDALEAFNYLRYFPDDAKMGGFSDLVQSNPYVLEKNNKSLFSEADAQKISTAIIAENLSKKGKLFKKAAYSEAGSESYEYYDAQQKTYVTIKIDGYNYVALKWPTLSRELEKFLKDSGENGFSLGVIQYAAENPDKYPKFHKFILEFARGNRPNMDKPDWNFSSVLDEFKSAKDYLNGATHKEVIAKIGLSVPGLTEKESKAIQIERDKEEKVDEAEKLGKKERAKAKLSSQKKIERVNLMKDVNEAAKKEIDSFLESYRFDEALVAKSLEQNGKEIDPEGWNLGSPEALADTLDQIKMLGFNMDSSLMKSMAWELSKVSKPERRLNKPDGKGGNLYAEYYEKVLADGNAIEKLQDDEQFYKMFKFFVNIKTYAQNFEKAREVAIDKSKDAGKNKIIEGVRDVAGKAWSGIKSSVREGDILGLCLGAGGVYGIYKTFKMFGGSKEGDSSGGGGFMKFMWAAIGATGVYTVLKHYGVAFPGAKNLMASIDDTGMEGVHNSEIAPNIKEEVDEDTLNRVANIDIYTLLENYNDGRVDVGKLGPNFHEFRYHKPNDKFYTEKKERIGKEVGRIVELLKDQYTNTLQTDRDLAKYLAKTEGTDRRYLGKTLREVVGPGGILEGIDVHTLLFAMNRYSTINFKENLFFDDDLEKVQERMGNLLPEHNVNFNQREYEKRDDKRFYPVMIKDYPFYLGYSDDEPAQILIYDIEDIDNNPSSIHISQAKYKIPLEKSSANKDETIKKGIDILIQKNVNQRFKDIDLAGMSLADPTSKPQFTPGEGWKIELKAAQDAIPGIMSTNGKFYANVTFDSNGGTYLSVNGNPYRVDLGTSVAARNTNGLSLEKSLRSQQINARITNQFPALAPLLASGQMSFSDSTKSGNDYIFTYKFKDTVSNTEKSIKIKYFTNVNNGKFEIENEELLFNDPLFLDAYLDRAFETGRFSMVFENLKNVIDSAEEETLFYFVEGTWDVIKKMWNRGSVSEITQIGQAVSGSVPDNFSKTLIDLKQYELKQKVKNKILGQAKNPNFSIEDLNRILNEETALVLTKLENVVNYANSKTDDWENEEFAVRVLDPISRAGLTEDYYLRYMNFQNRLRQKYNLSLRSDINVSDYEKYARDCKRYLKNTVGVGADAQIHNNGRLAYPASPNPQNRLAYMQQSYWQCVGNWVLNGDKILTFEEAKNAGLLGNFAPISQVDVEPPLDNSNRSMRNIEVFVDPINITDLEASLIKAIDDLFVSDLKDLEINNKKISSEFLGAFMEYYVFGQNGQTPRRVLDAEYLARFNRRSTQIAARKELVRTIREEIVANYESWEDVPGLIERVNSSIVGFWNSFSVF